MATNIREKKVKVNSDVSVGDLKEQFCEGTDKTAENLRLFFGGKELKDAESLAAAKLMSDVVLMANFRKASITQDVS